MKKKLENFEPYYNENDLLSFGEYLLENRHIILRYTPVGNTLRVRHEDIEIWKKQRKKGS